MFDLNDLSYPPDIILPDLWPEYITDISQLQVLTTWSITNVHCFLRLLIDLYEKFSEYQKALFANVADERIKFEFATLQHDTRVRFLVLEEPVPEYHCMIPIEVDFNIYNSSKNTTTYCRIIY